MTLERDQELSCNHHLAPEAGLCENIVVGDRGLALEAASSGYRPDGGLLLGAGRRRRCQARCGGSRCRHPVQPHLQKIK